MLKLEHQIEVPRLRGPRNHRSFSHTKSGGPPGALRTTFRRPPLAPPPSAPRSPHICEPSLVADSRARRGALRKRFPDRPRTAEVPYQSSETTQFRAERDSQAPYTLASARLASLKPLAFRQPHRGKSLARCPPAADSCTEAGRRTATRRQRGVQPWRRPPRARERVQHARRERPTVSAAGE